MITVTILEDQLGYKGFTVKGHAMYAEAGNDIYCAAVSMLTLNTANAIEALTATEVVSSARSGSLVCSFPNGIDRSGTVLMDAMLMGLRDIQKNTKEKYVKVQHKEVTTC